MVSPATLETLRGLAKAGLIRHDDAEAICRTVGATDTSAPVLLSPKTAAQRLGCCVRTIHRLAEDGRLQRVYLRPGKPKSLRFRETEVSAIVSAGGEG